MRFTILFLFLSYCLSSLGQVSHNPIKVEAPFEMPTINECVFPEKSFPITKYGAKPGKNCTAAIAKAISACNRAGGGRVIVPAGNWTTGPIHLKSNVCLYLDKDAVLSFTDSPADYLPAVPTSWEGMECYNYSPLVYAYDCENVGIAGPGTLSPVIDFWRGWFGRPQPHLDALKQLYDMSSTDIPVEERQMAQGECNLRPHLIHLNRCRNILLDGFKIRQSPFWTIHIYHCENGIARNLDVSAHGHNNDGIDLEMTRDFLVEDCIFDQGDDAVVIKAGRNQDAWRLNRPTENIVIRNCTIKAGHTLLGIGSEISGGIRNVYMHDCHAPSTVHRLFFIKTNHRRGAFVENIYMKNVSAAGALSVLEIDTDVLYQWRNLVPTYETRITNIDEIYAENIECTAAKNVFAIKGDSRKPIGTVDLKDIHIGTVGKTSSPVEYIKNLRTENIVCDSINPQVLPQLDPYVSNK